MIPCDIKTLNSMYPKTLVDDECLDDMYISNNSDLKNEYSKLDNVQRTESAVHLFITDNNLATTTFNDNTNPDMYEIYSIRSIHKRAHRDSWGLSDSPSYKRLIIPAENQQFSMVLH